MVWLPDHIWEAQKRKGESGGKGGKVVTPADFAKAFGKGKQFGKVADSWQEKEAIEGLAAAIRDGFAPALEDEPAFNLDDLLKKVRPKIIKISEKYAKDERTTVKGTDKVAQVLIEELVESVWNAIAAPCYDRPWLQKISLLQAMVIITMHTFGSTKLFHRTLAPSIEKYVQESIEKAVEEQRIQSAMWEAVEVSGVTEDYKKKTSQNLIKAFDEAHMKAPYGSTRSKTPGLAMLQDFVKGWMTEFANRAWDVLENGCNAASKDEQVLFLTVLFQNLTDATTACVPLEIMKGLDSMPTSPWNFIAETAEAVMKEPGGFSAGGGGGAAKKKRKN